MKIFDVHTHLQDKRYEDGAGVIVERANANSVTSIMCCGLYESDWQKVYELSEKYSGVYPAFGIHPWFSDSRSGNWLEYLEHMLLKGGSCVGEIGLDGIVVSGDVERDMQERVFKEQLILAKKLDLPVNIHCRKAWGRLIEIIDKTGLPERGGVIHSYSGSHEIVKVLEKRGLMISFSGSVTKDANKKAGKSLMAVSDKHLLIETDSPDINPEGITGLNEPAFIVKVLESVAEKRGRTPEEISEITWQNSIKLFGKRG